MNLGKCVCVIDDDDLIRAHVAALLEPEGYRVLEAGDAKTGLKVIGENKPDVALIDLIMPDMDGVELIAEIRLRWPDLRIVAMSAGGRIGPELYLDIAEKMGANACLSKPLTLPTLMQALG